MTKKNYNFALRKSVKWKYLITSEKQKKSYAFQRIKTSFVKQNKIWAITRTKSKINFLLLYWLLKEFFYFRKWKRNKTNNFLKMNKTYRIFKWNTYVYYKFAQFSRKFYICKNNYSHAHFLVSEIYAYLLINLFIIITLTFKWKLKEWK